MHFGYIEELLQDPKGTLLFLLLALPGRLLFFPDYNCIQNKMYGIDLLKLPKRIEYMGI